MAKITKDTFLADILKVAKTRKILEKYNFPCLQCPFAQTEMGQLKIGDICKIYPVRKSTSSNGVYRLDLNKILKDLNSIKS
jgi:hypothetical protein